MNCCRSLFLCLAGQTTNMELAKSSTCHVFLPMASIVLWNTTLIFNICRTAVKDMASKIEGGWKKTIAAEQADTKADTGMYNRFTRLQAAWI
jgi:hypothetical protein